MYYLGIDWATEKHDLCLLDESGTILRQLTISQTDAGFERLQKLVEQYGAENVQVNIERSDGLLVDWMLEQGWALHVTPTLIVARRRPRRSKSDPSDAYLLAHLLRLKDPDCRRLTRSSSEVLYLRELARALDRVVSDQRRLASRLNYLLHQYFPAATRLFAHVETLICLAFLEAYPTPEAARRLTRYQLRQFLKSQKYTFLSRLDEIYQQLQIPMPTASVPDGYVSQVRVLIPLLRELHHTRARLERELPLCFSQHPEAAWWRSFPGTKGPLTPARLLAWIGDDRQRFPTAEALQAIAGTAPVTRRSGKSKYVEFRRACSRPLRKAIDDFARQSLRYSSWAREYRAAQIARGHGIARANRALANRWLKIIWTLWQRREFYDEAKHEANRQKQMMPALKAS
ncbi:MAG: IS110 family transposase [Chloroflexi bacterium]|nr:IS110 family transposase [Chloroflexota bacterium]